MIFGNFGAGFDLKLSSLEEDSKAINFAKDIFYFPFLNIDLIVVSSQFLSSFLRRKNHCMSKVLEQSLLFQIIILI